MKKAIQIVLFLVIVVLGYILVQPTLVTLSMDADPAQSGLCTGLIGFAVFACGGVGSAVGTAIVSHGGYALLWMLVLLCLGLQALISRRVLRWGRAQHRLPAE